MVGFTIWSDLYGALPIEIRAQQMNMDCMEGKGTTWPKTEQ